jgi:hypothetical protein
LRGEVRITNGATVRWRENIERKKESEYEERERERVRYSVN